MEADKREPSRSSGDPAAAHLQQNFSLGDISLPLSLTTAQHISSSSVPRVQLPQNPLTKRPARPSSASDDRIVMLPTVSDVENSRLEYSVEEHEARDDEGSHQPGSSNVLTESAAPPSEESSSHPPSGLSEGQFGSNSSWGSISAFEVDKPEITDYDWTTFIHAYALGRWNPHKTPDRPQQTTANPAMPLFSSLSEVSSPHSGISTESRLDTARIQRAFLSPEALDASIQHTSSPPIAAPQRLFSEQSSLISDLASTDSSNRSLQSTSTAPTSLSSAPLTFSSASSIPLESLSSSSPAAVETSSPPPSPTKQIDVPAQNSSSFRKRRTDMPLTLPAAHRARRSTPDIRVGTPGSTPFPIPWDSGSFSSSSNVPASPILSPDLATAAATMRWAASGVSIAPLALPSPEHELTDPMRNFTPAIPSSLSDEFGLRDTGSSTDASADLVTTAPSSTTGRRQSRLSSYWDPLEHRSPLSTIEASPLPSPDHVEAGDDEGHKLPQGNKSPLSEGNSPQAGSQSSQGESRSSPSENSRPASARGGIAPEARLPPPATAPIIRTTASHGGDYFSIVDAAKASRHDINITRGTLHHGPPLAGPTPPLSVPVIPQSTTPLRESMSVPQTAAHKKTPLTRQTSSPLPSAASDELSSSAATATPVPGFGVRLHKYEGLYQSLGYLVPPSPPDELQRRRALYKYNILNTGPDANFDRIAHLAKLVFSAKVVAICLVDGNEVWYKSQSGLGRTRAERNMSFCGHAILQRSDEPIIINDTVQDWRFAKNPFVVGAPFIRFYAGANLRTQDGFNVGTLCVMDESPRPEFSPRQRHTLKEFAAIVIREMELWRDKIQLRIRDRIQLSMEHFTRECLEIDSETAPGQDGPHSLLAAGSMDKIYERAAKLVKRTLDVEGAVVMDVSHFDVLETMNSAEGHMSLVLHYADSQHRTSNHTLATDDYSKFLEFFSRFPDGKVAEGIMPTCFRAFLPIHVQYALIVPIFNIDKRPFALLCAYNTADHSKPYLEGHELSYLRAIGVIILSAVLKRRMILADKAKSLFISNISHELRTPLHGILAAAELLEETYLDHNQISFLQTVQACGTSLVETVNHVLDFTKLSGNAKSGGVENVIMPNKVNLMQLVEEAVEGCWIGHRARMSSFTNSEIGSVYAPPSQTLTPLNYVETVVDIDYRERGWNLRCERGGIRRVLMNLLGNSLKFTSDGTVHVALRELPPSQESPNKVRVELSVLDTGKGISENFLKNQLFHPFSQENPLQSGTGLGLAIVNSIVRSDSIDGKVDVWSKEGAGTEIRVTFDSEVPDDDDSVDSTMESWKQDDQDKKPGVSLIGFDGSARGGKLLRDVTVKYLVSWWNLEVRPDDSGGIVIVNEDPTPVVVATENREFSRPFIILSSARGDTRLMAIVADFERVGGFCRVVFKPGGPSRLGPVLKLCVHMVNIGRVSQRHTPQGQPEELDDDHPTTLVPMMHSLTERITPPTPLSRRRSDEGPSNPPRRTRPTMAVRSITSHPLSRNTDEPGVAPERAPSPKHSGSDSPTFTVGAGGTLLKSSVGTVVAHEDVRVLVVEDNSILRNLLTRWLNTKGYDYRDAANGQDGVRLFEEADHFDIVLLDMSMPVLDGVGATVEMRRIEAARQRRVLSGDHDTDPVRPTRILALTGMSSLEDKRKAFEAGVDGYLVKPVAFKTLEAMFRQLGIS